MNENETTIRSDGQCWTCRYVMNEYDEDQDCRCWIDDAAIDCETCLKGGCAKWQPKE